MEASGRHQALDCCRKRGKSANPLRVKIIKMEEKVHRLGWTIFTWSRSLNSLSHCSCELTKTRILPCSCHSPRSSSKRMNLSSDCLISTNWVISSFTTLRPPTWISTGDLRVDLAIISTCSQLRIAKLFHAGSKMCRTLKHDSCWPQLSFPGTIAPGSQWQLQIMIALIVRLSHLR